MLQFGNISCDETQIPQAVVSKMLNSKFAHIMSNEVSSGVVGKIRGEIAGKDGKRAEVTTEQVKAFRANEGNAEKIAGWEDELRQAKLAAILDGTLAVHVVRAPTRDPVEAAVRALAKMSVVATLKANGSAFPGKDETLEVETPEGVVSLTGEDLIDRRLAHPKLGPEIRKAAERKVAEDKRLREATAKGAAGESGGLASLL